MIFVDFILGLVLGLMFGSVFFLLLGFYHSKITNAVSTHGIKRPKTSPFDGIKRVTFKTGDFIDELDLSGVIPFGHLSTAKNI